MSREEQRARTQRDALAGHRPTTGVVLAVIAAVLLAACGGVNEQRVGDDNLRFFVHGRTAGGSAGMAAEVVGVLTAADGCVLLEQDGTRYPVVWPSGTSVADADPLTVELPSGAELELGDRVRGGGGYLSAADVGIEVPDECLNEYGEVAVFNPDDDPVAEGD